MKGVSESFRERFRSLALVEFDLRELLPRRAGLQNLDYLLRAAGVADNIFWQQVLPDTDKESLLARAGADEELREIMLFNYGPYDRLDNDAPVLPVAPKFPGEGFYPRDLTREEFTGWVLNNPNCKPSFESPYTVIRRIDGRLAAIPYHEAYRDHIEQLSDLLTKASATELHPLFRQFLARRAQDVRTDDYYESDSLWTRLVDNPIDLVIGPFEVYEDQLLGLKAAYEAIVLARDFEESDKLLHFQHELPSMGRALEGELGRPVLVQDRKVELSVASLIYAGGDARKAIPAVGLTLPNDERVLEEVGSRQVILKNVLEAKFRWVVWPIMGRLLRKPPEDEQSAFRSFFNHVLFHEISHSLGPHRITVDGESTTVNRTLRQYYSLLDEVKADTLGACLTLALGDRAETGTFLETYVSGFLRAIRFGLSQAHGAANAIQFRYLLQEGALAVDSREGQLFVDHSLSRRALMKLASNVIDIQERGDFQAADRFVGTFCVMNPEIEGLMRRVSDLPIDIRIRYKDDGWKVDSNGTSRT